MLESLIVLECLMICFVLLYCTVVIVNTMMWRDDAPTWKRIGRAMRLDHKKDYLAESSVTDYWSLIHSNITPTHPLNRTWRRLCARNENRTMIYTTIYFNLIYLIGPVILCEDCGIRAYCLSLNVKDIINPVNQTLSEVDCSNPIFGNNFSFRNSCLLRVPWSTT